MEAKTIEKILSKHGVSQSAELSKALEEILKQFADEKLKTSPVNLRRRRS